MKFAVPFDYSMHNYLLRYYLAEHGLDPDTDVQLHQFSVRRQTEREMQRLPTG